MQLHLYPAPGARYYTPGMPKAVGQFANLLGRKMVKKPGAKKPTFPATAEGFKFDSDNDEVVRSIRSAIARGGDNPFLPADEATARFFNLTFVPVKLCADGEFHPAEDTKPPKKGDK